MSAEWDFQAAIYTTLIANAPLMAAIDAVYDERPQAIDGGDVAQFPFVTMGRALFAEGDTKTKLGHDVLLRVHTWSRTGSMKEAKQIQGLIYEALHRNEPSMTGHTVVSLTRESSDTLKDGGNYHGVCEYRALIEKI